MARKGNGGENPPKQQGSEVELNSPKVPAEVITEEIPKQNENPEWWKSDGSDGGELR